MLARLITGRTVHMSPAVSTLRATSRCGKLCAAKSIVLVWRDENVPRYAEHPTVAGKCGREILSSVRLEVQ